MNCAWINDNNKFKSMAFDRVRWLVKFTLACHYTIEITLYPHCIDCHFCCAVFFISRKNIKIHEWGIGVDCSHPLELKSMTHGTSFKGESWVIFYLVIDGINGNSRHSVALTHSCRQNRCQMQYDYHTRKTFHINYHRCCRHTIVQAPNQFNSFLLNRELF